jgi:hypothetical protein
MQALPAEHAFPLAVRKDGERLADIAEDRRRSPEPTVRRLRRGDAVDRPFEPGETRLVAIDPMIRTRFIPSADMPCKWLRPNGGRP